MTILAAATMAWAAALTPGELSRHIARTMHQSVRENRVDTLGQLGLPRPYSVPCIRGAFQDMYYWDTYFTNVGLLCDGDTAQAANNIIDIAHLVERVGYMPNGSNVALLNRSQPPYLALMVRDLLDATADTAMLRAVMPALEREYRFWMTERITPVGLNRYGHSATDVELTAFYMGIAPRVGIDPMAPATDSVKTRIGAHLLAEAESGWDFNPRFEGRCMDFCPVDLNALMYGFERAMAGFERMLGRSDGREWDARAESRRRLMSRYLTDAATGVMFDYDYRRGRLSAVLSAASMWPLWMGVATEEQAAATVGYCLPRLEAPHGLYTCEPGEAPRAFQWDAPNGWAACHLAAVEGLMRYGYRDDARRLARKYVDSLVAIHAATGQLWEKYNVVEGSIRVQDEYPMPGDFMGWTAGVYQCLYRLLTE